MFNLTKQQALAILELHKTVRQKPELLLLAIKVASTLTPPVG